MMKIWFWWTWWVRSWGIAWDEGYDGGTINQIQHVATHSVTCFQSAQLPSRQWWDISYLIFISIALIRPDIKSKRKKKGKQGIEMCPVQWLSNWSNFTWTHSSAGPSMEASRKGVTFVHMCDLFGGQPKCNLQNGQIYRKEKLWQWQWSWRWGQWCWCSDFLLTILPGLSGTWLAVASQSFFWPKKSFFAIGPQFVSRELF